MTEISSKTTKWLAFAASIAAASGVYAGLQSFGIDLPRPVWQNELRNQNCRMARIEADYYGRKLDREGDRLVELNDATDLIPADDRAAIWKSRDTIRRSEEEIARLALIVDPAKETVKECFTR